ncbi:MAG TPA: carbohydrate binding domain-containing protein [Opitutaceae bacterium]|nr:carbohydrate binding domain-containing protein [Opitutaceae bacterium]
MPPRILTSALSAIVLVGAAVAAADLQPFRMPWDDASPGITNLQGWQPQPAGAAGRVTVSADGRYQVGGARIRFLGVNVSDVAAFPTHAQAEAHAARLARFGFNAVRFHHMDANWAPNEVLIDYAGGTSRNLSAERLDRLHYFMAQLAARGIYANINLLVSRGFVAADGLGAEIAQLGWKDQHILGFFNDTALALQQEYATKLLSAPNPYRAGQTLARDPAVAFVEILNENGLLQKWYEGVLDTMPAVYRAQLASRWNTWLAGRYADTAALLAAWGAIDQPLQESLLRNGNFASGQTGWTTERHDTAAATVTTTTDFSGQPALRINVTSAGSADWHVQFNQGSLALAAGGVYTVSFWAKAGTAVPLRAGLARAYGDYGAIGGSVMPTLGTSWQRYTFVVQAAEADSNVRLNFNGFGNRLCTVWLADVKLQPGGTLGGLPPGTSLEARTVPAVAASGTATTAAARRDWTRFLLALEVDYWTAMRRHVKETLGFEGIVWGSIAANSPLNAQAGLDAMDSHTYWQHPVWPAGLDWDPVQWTVQNRSMVDDVLGGLVGEIANQRVKGRPHNVTEYQHPSPNTYGSEGPLLAAAYGALQDWDSLWMFDYRTGASEYVSGFFDHGGHPGKMANNLLAAALFRRGDVAPALNEYTMALTPEAGVAIAAEQGRAWSVGDGAHLGVPGSLALVSRLSLDIGADATGLAAPPAAPTGSVKVSDTGELRWDNSLPAQGVVTVDTARTKAVVGHVGSRTWDLGGVTIAPGATRQDWCTIGLTVLDGGAIGGGAGARGVVVTTGDLANTGMAWKDSTRTSVGANWGAAPTLIEVIPATVTLPVSPARVSAWALDARGQRTTAVAVGNSGGKAQLSLGQNGATVWYEFQIAAVEAPSITTQPADATTALGGVASLTVATGGATPLSFQWYRGETGDASQPVAGATGASYTTPALTAWSRYWVRVANDGGQADSRTALVKVTGGTMTLADWTSQGGVAPAQRGPLDTPAGDGVANLLKYALGVAPLESASSRLPVAVLDQTGGSPAVALVFTQNTGAQGIRYVMEVSADLATWNVVDHVLEVLSANPDGTRSVRMREATPPVAAWRFARLRIEPSP